MWAKFFKFPCTLISAVLLIAMLTILTPESVEAQETGNKTSSQAVSGKSRTGTRIEPIRTDSPRHTLATFLRLRSDLEAAISDYRRRKNRDRWNHAETLTLQLVALVDLSAVPRASRRELGVDTVYYLLDILGRIQLPAIDKVPDEEAFADRAGPVSWRIPHTPIRIARIAEGEREGEFLFSSRTIVAAPRFFRGVEDVPLRSALDIVSWSRALPQITGPLIPGAFLSIVPEALKDTWLDTPIWKILLLLVVFVAIVWLLASLHKFMGRREREPRLRYLLLGLLTPAVALVAVLLLNPFVHVQVNVSGRFATRCELAILIGFYGALAWIFWLLVLAFFEWIIGSPQIDATGVDANLLRLAGRVIGLVGIVLILAFGAQELGLPVLSLLAGLGIGGLAVALAIRPTLENLIGGVMLFLDKPVRVGDFCSFGNYTGTVETIGMRSTEIRAVDRTLISIPNAKFADMELVNWAQCDRMLINELIGLRYETTPDQLRNVLARMREMFHAHPRIDPDTIRVRFSGYGASSLDITIRVYALTREWNDFFAIKEDVLLRVNDIVADTGSGFAFPSQTLYMGRDSGLDEERSKAAEEEVKSWRRLGKLPFPRLLAERVKELGGTLDYPPRGSVEHTKDAAPTAETEGLSAEPAIEESASAEPLSAEPKGSAETRPKSPAE